MPRIIRLVKKSELIGYIQTYISQDHGMTPPSRATLYRLLNLLPANSPKAMRGINAAKGLPLFLCLFSPSAVLFNSCNKNLTSIVLSNFYDAKIVLKYNWLT